MAKRERIDSLELYKREETGTTRANASRHAGRVPGVLFGHGAPSVPVAIDARALAELLSGGDNRIVDATLDGGRESVMLRDVQRHPVSRRPMTADFQRVSLTESIVASVGVVTRGTAVGVRDFDGVMDVVMRALEIRGPAGSLPEQLDVDVAALGIGDHITAGEVPLPPGFTLVTQREAVVVSIETSRAGVAEEAGAPATATEGEAAAPATEPAATP